MVRIYEAKYLPAGFTWEQYLAEPAWVVDALVAMWMDRQKEEDDALKGILPKRKR